MQAQALISIDFHVLSMFSVVTPLLLLSLFPSGNQVMGYSRVS